MKKVLLLNPNQMKPAVAPIALDYLSDALQEKGFQPDILDLCFSTDVVQSIATYFHQNQVGAIGVTIRNTDDTLSAGGEFFLPRIKQVIDCLKQHSSSPIILGGAGFSIMPESILSFCDVDLGIWGEGEYSLPLLISQLAAGEGIQDVPGLVFRMEEGFKRNSPHYITRGDLPVPQRNLVDCPIYFTKGGMGNIESKRGCPMQCIYCADPIGKGAVVRYRSPESVVSEIELLLAQGIDHFHFCDSEFNHPESHARGICQELIDRDLGERIRWYAYCCSVPFSDELATLFLKSGCGGINFGVDSGSDRMLHVLGRNFRVADLQHTAEVCHRNELIFLFDLLLGGPGETRESVKETIQLMKKLSPNRVGTVLGIRIFQGTKLASMVTGEGPLSANRNLHGSLENNHNFLAPVFYIDSALGSGADDYLHDLIDGDERFFYAERKAGGQNYNYNDNSVLTEAIRSGYRGAYWDILRRLAEK